MGKLSTGGNLLRGLAIVLFSVLKLAAAAQNPNFNREWAN